MWTSTHWRDYELLDCGAGRRLERWGGHILVRPDPQAIWSPQGHPRWETADATYHRSSGGGGSWEVRGLPESWRIGYRDLTFNIKPMSFKHTGVFPEQAANWDFIMAAIGGRREPTHVLNLFAYTGGASLAAARAGASVCHVDAARGMVAWARENAAASGLEGAPIRYIVDDCVKFIQREQRRGRRYDAIIMDPPSYGRGPAGEIWRFEDGVESLVRESARLLSDRPLFFIINSYTAGISPAVTAYILAGELQSRLGGTVEAGELGLVVSATGRTLPCGGTSRWLAQPPSHP